MFASPTSLLTNSSNLDTNNYNEKDLLITVDLELVKAFRRMHKGYNQAKIRFNVY